MLRPTKALLGNYIEVTWRDPIGVQRQPLEVANAMKGLSGLATWSERGIVDDMTDGVLRIVHSEGREPGSGKVDEISYTLVPEDLIISISIFKAEALTA